jgi:hypothetical protein
MRRRTPSPSADVVPVLTTDRAAMVLPRIRARGQPPEAALLSCSPAAGEISPEAKVLPALGVIITESGTPDEAARAA